MTFAFIALLILAATGGGMAALVGCRWVDAKTHALDLLGLIAIGVAVICGYGFAALISGQ